MQLSYRYNRAEKRNAKYCSVSVQTANREMKGTVCTPSGKKRTQEP